MFFDTKNRANAVGSKDFGIIHLKIINKQKIYIAIIYICVILFCIDRERGSMSKNYVRILVILGEIMVICVLALIILWPESSNSGTEVKSGGKVKTKAAVQASDAQSVPASTTVESPVTDEQVDPGRGQLSEQIRPEEKTAPVSEQVAVREEEKKVTPKPSGAVEEAAFKASMYDYDGAIEVLKAIPQYETIEEVKASVQKFESAREKLVKWEDNTQISHLFVHSLIVDTARAFRKGSSQPVGYNRYMTTVGEFKAMLQSLYDKGYVLVSMHDIAERYIGEDGVEKLRKKAIYLPEGKTPFVLSQDDVNYYAYMDNDGFADRLVIGEDGRPTCQYTDTDGTVSYGEYDVLPIVDNFILEHPDFSYKGAKGILAVTGYEGALGYDTGWHMYDLDNPAEAAKLKEQQEAAKKVADAIKADGWEFASHSYTHTDMKTNSFDKVVYDTDKWEREVQPILGDTDLYIYPFGSDICDWRGYKGDKYEYLKKAGFWYFCNVDASRYWIQITDNYMRMGRINADGERMMKTPQKLDYFFDSAAILDKTRPRLE